MPTPESSYGRQPIGTKTGTQASGTNEAGAEADSGDRAARIAELRADLAALVADVKQIAEARASQVKDVAIDSAEAGVDMARDTIRSHPVPAIAVAFVVGAAVAVALTPAPRRSMSARLSDWAPDISRSSLGDMGERLQRAASHNGNTLLSAFERVVDSVSSIDPKSSLTPSIEKAAAWLSSLRGTMNGK